jgi:hypothetical protein
MSSSLLQAVAWSLVLTVTAFGCDSNGGAGSANPCLTALRINLEVGDGAVIDEVDYEITRNGMTLMGGTIDTSAPGATASVESFGIPPGEGYVVTMVATSVDGTLICGGAASFDVGVGVSMEVEVMLHCKGAERFGGVRVNGKLNICAELEKVIVAPLQTSSGYALDVQAQAGDEEDDSVEYSWTATGGSFDDASAAQTIFTCTEAVEEQITIEISDDEFEYCADAWTIDVNCVEDEGTGGTGGSGASGGNGGNGGTGGTGGSGASGGNGGTGGSGASGGDGGNGGSGASGGNGGGGDGGSGASGGNGGGGDGGSGASGGNGGGGGSGTGGSGGGPDECLVSVSVQ